MSVPVHLVSDAKEIKIKKFLGEVLERPKFGNGIVMMRGDTRMTILIHDGNAKFLAINAEYERWR